MQTIYSCRSQGKRTETQRVCWTDCTVLPYTLPFILPLKVCCAAPPPPAPPWRGACLHTLATLFFRLVSELCCRGCITGQTLALPVGRQQNLLEKSHPQQWRQSSCSETNTLHFSERQCTASLVLLIARGLGKLTVCSQCAFEWSPTCDLGSAH